MKILNYVSISSDEKILSGRPHIKGRRLSVLDVILGLYFSENVEDYNSSMDLTDSELSDTINYCNSLSCIKNQVILFCEKCILSHKEKVDIVESNYSLIIDKKLFFDLRKLTDNELYQIESEGIEGWSIANGLKSKYNFIDLPHSARRSMYYASDAVGGMGTGMEVQGGSYRLTDGKYSGNISLKYYESGWQGRSRAQIKTFKLGTAAGRLGTAGTIGLCVYDIGSNAYLEGGFGTNTQKATGRSGGSLGGGAFGAYIGAHFFGDWSDTLRNYWLGYIWGCGVKSR